MSEPTVNYSVYTHFHSIWRDIDNNNLEKLGEVNHDYLRAQINEKEQGLTPLFLACQRKYPAMIHYLLQAGADPNIGEPSPSLPHISIPLPSLFLCQVFCDS